jgi:CRISPR/Cas system CMR subunit Cmr4 (Cas7 group RAMP superfamily)
MKTFWLTLTLKSDTTFGRGDGVAGVVDTEVQHDKYGLPYLSGKTLKGLLGAECAEILFALKQAASPNLEACRASAQRLFGEAGSKMEQTANMHVGDAQLPQDLRLAIMDEVDFGGKITRQEILDTLTAIRRQSAIEAETGAPEKETLRASRVILRKTIFVARLDFEREPEENDLALLAAVAKAFRRAGSERHRGRGRLQTELYSEYPFQPEETADAVTAHYFDIFRRTMRS